MIAVDAGEGGKDLVLLAAGSVLLAVYLFRFLRGQDLLRTGPSPVARFNLYDAVAIYLIGLLAQQFLFAAGMKLWPDDEGAPNRVLLTYSALLPVAAFAFFFYIRRNRDHGPRGRGALSGVLAWIAWFPVVYAVFFATQMLFEAMGREWGDQRILEILRKAPAWKFALSAAVCAPLWEETVFRGMLYPAIRRKLPTGAAILVTSALFALVHWPAYGQMPALFVLSVAITWTYERTGTLAAPIAFHAAFNGWTFLMEILKAGAS